MSFGFEVYNALGQLLVRYDKFPLRILFERNLPAAESSSAIVPGLSTARYSVYVRGSITVNASGATAHPAHLVTISGDTVSWSSRGYDSYLAILGH